MNICLFQIKHIKTTISFVNKSNYFSTYIILILMISKFGIIDAEMSPSTIPSLSNNDMLDASGKQCNIYENEALHSVMDRVCHLCHEMFSHERPNMRSDCRADCFRNSQFKKCLLLFRPSRASRHNKAKNFLLF